MPDVFSGARISLYEGEGSCRAFASVKVADAVVLTGMRVIEGKNGLFVGMASRKKKDGSYEDLFFPTTKELRDDLSRCVLAAYRKEAGLPSTAASSRPQGGDNDLPF